jgi:hypothetical protein
VKTNEPEWENPRQTAEVIGVSRATVYGLIGAGKLDARKLLGRTLVSVASRKELMESLPKAEIKPRKVPQRKNPDLKPAA